MAKENTLQNWKAWAFDWVFKGLIGIVCYLVADMRSDVKLLMQTVPGLKVEIENLKDKSLMERLRGYESAGPMKHEDYITYDSLKRK